MASPFFVQPAQFGQGLQSLAGSVQQFGQQQRAQEKAAEQEAYTQRAKKAMAEAFQSGDPGAIRSAVIQYPEIAETAKQMFGFTNDQTEQVARETYRLALSETDPAKQAAIMEGGIETVSQFGGNPRMMSRDLQMLKENPEAAIRSMRGGYASIASDAELEAVFPELASGGLTAGQREFQSLIEATKSSDPTVREAAEIELGLRERAGTLSASERAAVDEVLGQKVAAQAGAEAEAKERGKLESQAELLPGIRAQVRQAEEKAKSRGETLSELSRAETALPGLKDMVNKLSSLSQIATYTTTGRIRDTLVKELGFGSTEGATARAQIESIVDNEILPLLKQTFGAQFTEKEGDRLIRTLMDINAPPAEKLARLNAFYETKVKEVEQLQERAEKSKPDQQSQGGMAEQDADAFINSVLGQGQ